MSRRISATLASSFAFDAFTNEALATRSPDDLMTIRNRANIALRGKGFVSAPADAAFDPATVEHCAKIADSNRTDDASLWDRAAETIAAAIRASVGKQA